MIKTNNNGRMTVQGDLRDLKPKNYLKQFMLDNDLECGTKIIVEYKGNEYMLEVQKDFTFKNILRDSDTFWLRKKGIKNICYKLLMGELEFEKITRYEEISFQEAVELMVKFKKVYVDLCEDGNKYPIDLDEDSINTVFRVGVDDRFQYYKLSDIYNLDFYKDTN